MPLVADESPPAPTHRSPTGRTDLGGLTEEEHRFAVRRLGRAPNQLELGMLAAMWSEHCGYKNSKPLLSRLPTRGPGVLQGPGENAGAVDIGDGLAVVVKMESHNHPSAVEPVQGAATGVGGILRDIFTMGARPIALLDSLRFGPPEQGRSRYLTQGVVAGIAAYGNCIGVPTVGGEIFFDDSFAENPLVNVMCLGLADGERLMRARAGQAGDAVMLVGASTGRDGIHGATFASAEMDEGWEERRPAVQVGNPFLEKLLLEACLEVLPLGCVVAMQDLGAAGLTSSCAEVAARGGRGMRVDVANVPRRESRMTPYEVMLSESQERMLLIVPPASVERVNNHFERWELNASVIGEITDDGLFRVEDGGLEVGCVPATVLTEDTPTYTRPLIAQPEPPPASLPPEPTDLGPVLLRLMGSPNLCSRAPVFSQYDHTVQANTVIPPGVGAAVLRIKGTTKALVVTTDGNPRYCRASPRRGAQIAVAEAARNLACRGAQPVAVTDCLNFGNPERQDVYWALAEAIDGIGEACRALEVPVVSGNVSLYNETSGQAVAASPIIGMVGLIENVDQVVGAEFGSDGDRVLLIGPPETGLQCSEYLAHFAAPDGPAPDLDLEQEWRVQEVCRALGRAGLLTSAQDCSDGGLIVALAESALAGGIGFLGSVEALDRLVAAADGRTDAALYGEAQSRIVVSCGPEAAAAIRDRCGMDGVDCMEIGEVGGQEIVWGPRLQMSLEALRDRWSEGLEYVLT